MTTEEEVLEPVPVVTFEVGSDWATNQVAEARRLKTKHGSGLHLYAVLAGDFQCEDYVLEYSVVTLVVFSTSKDNPALQRFLESTRIKYTSNGYESTTVAEAAEVTIAEIGRPEPVFLTFGGCGTE